MGPRAIDQLFQGLRSKMESQESEDEDQEDTDQNTVEEESKA